MKIEKIKEIIRSNKNYLNKRFKVKSIEIFGSYARGEQRKDSDLDILVEFEEPIDLINFIELENYLSGLLSIKVDLVTKNALKPRIRDSILKEAIRL